MLSARDAENRTSLEQTFAELAQVPESVTSSLRGWPDGTWCWWQQDEYVFRVSRYRYSASARRLHRSIVRKQQSNDGLVSLERPKLPTSALHRKPTCHCRLTSSIQSAVYNVRGRDEGPDSIRSGSRASVSKFGLDGGAAPHYRYSLLCRIEQTPISQRPNIADIIETRASAH